MRGELVEQPAEDLLGVGRPDGLERTGDVLEPSVEAAACAINQSRRAHVRENGCAFASESAPQVAWRMWSMNNGDATCSHASASWLRIDACGGAGSFKHRGGWLAGRLVAEAPAIGQRAPRRGSAA